MTITLNPALEFPRSQLCAKTNLKCIVTRSVRGLQVAKTKPILEINLADARRV